MPAAMAAPLPEHLSDTGLFVAGSTTVVRPEILSFTPQYPLWSDGAVKRRWLHLPTAGTIDAAQPNAWEFPVARGLERILHRPARGNPLHRAPETARAYATYVWTEDGHDALLAPAEGIAALTLPEQARSVCDPGAAGLPCLPRRRAGAGARGQCPATLAGPRSARAACGAPAPRRRRPAQPRRAGWLRNLPQPLIDKAPRIEAASPASEPGSGLLHG